MVTFVDRTLVDGCRVHQEHIPVERSSPLKRAREAGPSGAAPQEEPTLGRLFPAPEAAPWESSERYPMMADEDPPLFDLPAMPEVKPADVVMQRWLRKLRDIYLRQLLRRDGCNKASTSICPSCKSLDAEGDFDAARRPQYCCEECSGGALYCKECCVARHQENPLHKIQRWNGIFFVKSSLKDLGLRIQFSHPHGEACTVPHAGHIGFVRLTAGAPYIQLLRAGWYPATEDRPQTAVTFVCLDKFVLHTLQAKTTAYDFYSVLERFTNNTGAKPPNRYQVFLRMARQYRHLLMLKRAGRAHNPTGVFGTGAGELAIECPVCPNPGVNLPEGWENAPPEDRFLYILFLALDACFRLKRRMVSSEARDPGLGTGWVYVLENGPYRHFLLTVTDQKEMSTCSGLAALDYANTKFSHGYSTTGVGMGVCTRHEFIQPNGVGDLQRGERFANMDYIFGSILHHKDPCLRKVISYDIVCQWWKYLFEQLKKRPPLVRINIILAMFRFVIPKMHIHSHMLACQVLFSLNLVPGSGQTDGEGIERPWANIGRIAMSTRNFWNWLKTIGLPALLRRRLDAARGEQEVQRRGFEKFSLQQAERVPAWKKMVEDFEKDGSNKNPYSMVIKGLTEAEVRLQFVNEEAEEAAKGVPALHEVTPSSFISAGLELEEDQRRVQVQAELKKAKTTAMKISMKGLRSKLNRGVARFRKLQATYSPGALQALSKRMAPADELMEDTPLVLPSALTEAEQEAGGCTAGPLKMEEEMRRAQCRTALVRLRNQLHIKSRFLLYKKIHSQHQGMNTRSRTIVARNESKIRLHSEKFQMAWAALLKITGDEAKVGWPKLKKEDIRCMQDQEELSRNAAKRRKANEQRRRKEDELREQGELPPLEDDGDDGDDMVTRGGENFREVSWIWMVVGTAGTDEELEDALRIKWAKAWARSRRWTEEVRMLEEEWRWLPVTYVYREQQWTNRAVAVPVATMDEDEAEGLIAYAAKQAQLYRDLAARAEITRTEVHPGRGKKWRVYQPELDPIMGLPDDQEENRSGDGGDDDDDEGEDDDEQGEFESDEELVMGGEVDED
ncbi:hypothetical protein FB451DRAFT_1392216 [Mycena latifolia]|nr:hypothetical protein FB451DRAFT_1392216 [Mycena latifolia]